MANTRLRRCTQVIGASGLSASTVPRAPRHDLSPVLEVDFPAFPERPAFDLHAVLIPAREVGGDFYDFFMIDDDHLCLVVGDVSGKGVPAALFMAVTKTIIKTAATSLNSPASIVECVNESLSEDNPTSMFVTLFIAIVNSRTGSVRHTNAGHNPPYVVGAAGSHTCLSTRHGVVLGAVAGQRYGEDELTLGPAETLLMDTWAVAVSV